MSCIIRKMVIGHADEMYALVKDFATSFYPIKEKFEESLNQLILDNSVWLFGAESKKEIVGYCLGLDIAVVLKRKLLEEN